MEKKDRFVDCTSNPHNIDPAVETIVAAIEHGQKEAAKTGKPLVVLMGENHSAPTHHLIQMAVIGELLKKGIDIRIGDEQDSASLLRFVHDKRIIPLSTGFARHVNAVFSDRDLSYRLLSAQSNRYMFARLSHFVKYSLFNQLPVEVDRNDYPRQSMANGLYFLDHAFYYYDKDFAAYDLHRQVIKLLKDNGYSQQDLDNLSATERNGMKIRNLHMVSKIIEKTQAHKPAVYIQLTGSAHVLGDENYPYSESLDGFLSKEYGFHVLPVSYTERTTEIAKKKNNPTCHLSDKDMSILLSRGVLIDGLSEKGFVYHRDAETTLRSHRGEHAELKQIIASSWTLQNYITSADVKNSSMIMTKLDQYGQPSEMEGKEKESLFDDVQRAAREHRAQERQARKNKKAGLKHV